MGLFPINPYEVSDQPMGEPDEDTCHLGISPLCTDEGAYDWKGIHCCGHCWTAAEKAMEANPAVLESDQVRR